MTTLVRDRATVPALAVWTLYVATWGATSGSGPASVAAWWLAGVGLVQLLAGPLSRARGSSHAERHVTGASATTKPAGKARPLGHAVEDWESEGGAVATG